MKKSASIILYTMLIACIVCACSDSMDIKQDYKYSIENLPLPKKLKQGETVVIEFSVIREGHYSDNSFEFRYFQSEGKGRLFDGEGRQCDMNRFYRIPKDEFRMFYQSDSDEQQQLDFVFQDSFGNKVEYMIEFDNDNSEDK